jgi:hypothetical protein
MPELKARAKVIARGTSAFTLATINVAITIGRTMPSTNYKVFYRQLTGLSVALPSTTNQTTTGFNAVVGVGVATTFEWIAVED